MERNDAIFSEILNENQSISGFLDAVFGFLSRRTDFYCEMKSPADKIGFPPGVNEQIVLKTLRKWKNNVMKSANEIPVAFEKEIVTSTHEDATHISPSEIMTENYEVNSNVSAPIFEPSEFYNGACFSHYCWSQSINEIELSVMLPEHVRTPKHLRVTIDQMSVKVVDQSNQVVILNESLARKWKASEAVWSVVAGKKLQITVDKITETWWDKLFISEPSLDTKTLNCSRPIEDLPQDTQAMIRKMQWDNQQKLLGNPTSKELMQHEMLKKAWNVDGSPFKGTPFDPNVVTFEN